MLKLKLTAHVISSMLVFCIQAEIFPINERRVPTGNRPPPASPWPMPTFWRHDKSVLTFSPRNLTFSSDLNDCDIVNKAFTRLQLQLETVTRSRGAAPSPSSDNGDSLPNTVRDDSHLPVLWNIEVKIQNRTCPDFPQFGVNEGYTLDVTAKVSLQASTAWGVLWGLQTLSQLMYMVDNKWLINQTSIRDEPRFKHRGFHLDTARHFYSIDILKRNLDVMSMNKFNVFHWHMVDTQAFPYKSAKFPQLAQKGAYSPGQTYSQNEIIDVISYARLLGIRVIPEFDSPAHVYSWGKGMPELLTSCWSDGKPNQAVHTVQADMENLNPSSNYTFEFLTEFMQEIKNLFVDDYLHLGMDEALYQCWRSNPNITRFMRKLGLSVGDYASLEQYYDERLLNIVRGMGRKTVIWEDPINNGANISKTTLVQLWKDYNLSPTQFKPWPTYMEAALHAGYHVIFSSCWYLNYIHYGQDWKNLYTCDPTSINASEEELSRIVGGEACTWSEYIDETNLLQVVWPRAAAVAERLWSAANITNTDDATLRLDQHRCRLVRLGIPAAPISPGYCHDNFNTDNSGAYELQLPHNQQDWLSTFKSQSVPTVGIQDPIVG